MKTKPFLMRLRVDTRELVEAAAREQKRSMSAVIDQALRDQLSARYAKLEPRLERFLGGRL